MKIRFICVYIMLFASLTTFAQKRQDYKKRSSFGSSYKKAKIDLDSIWAFSPTFINLSAGVWTPVGTLSEHFVTSPKFGLAFGMMISHKMKWEMNFTLYPMNHRKEVLFKADTSVVNARSISSLGMGGLLYYTLGKNRLFHIDLLAGAGIELIDSGIELPRTDKDDDRETATFTTYRLDFGTDILVNAIRNRNLGFRVMYSYIPYNNARELRTSIGTHSISTSLIYFLPKRKPAFRSVFL